MAVYTRVTHEQLDGFLAGYDLGRLTAHEGITKGVSNTNYHVHTTKGRYILTLFEPRRVEESDLPFFFAYADHLNDGGVLCPRAIADKNGNVIGRLRDRPAAIIEFLSGADIEPSLITVQHCEQMGRFLGRMHRAADGFGQTRGNGMGLSDWQRITKDISPKVDTFQTGMREILQRELTYITQNWPHDLPTGAVHADMFPDNVFWSKGHHIHAMIDYYFACTDFYAYDLAITLNAWCFDQDHMFDEGQFLAFMQGYESIRSLAGEERQALRILCRGAAYRILITRLEEYLAYDPKDTMMVPHDPAAYLARLQFHQTEDVRYV